MKKIIILLKNFISFPMRIINHISPFAIINDSKIDKKAYLSRKVRFYRSKIGKYSYVGQNSFIEMTSIGNFTSISENCYIGGASHTINWISTSPVFNKNSNVLKTNFTNKDFNPFSQTIIGNDVWIGEGAKIKAGVTISDGAIIGMGAVVTKDVGPFEIWVGNPAKMIKKRFDDNTIRTIMNSEWWNYDENFIKEISKNIDNPAKFIELMKGKQE